MSCYSPLEAWRTVGKKQLTFRAVDRASLLSPSASVILLSCGRCIGCRLDRACEWATRIMHEASCHEDNWFLTLTFADEFLPADNSIRTWHLQEFWYRCREHFRLLSSFSDSPLPVPPKFKYYAAGEYGERYLRVHYHAALFNFPLDDLKFFKMSGEFKLFTSSTLRRLWPWGHSYVGTLTFESAAYVARYICKKVLGDDAEEHYSRLGVEPERAWISQGLGRAWYEAYQGETFRDDYVVVRNGIKRPVPKAYLRWLESDAPLLHFEIKKSRIMPIPEKLNIIDDLCRGRHDVARLVKEAQLSHWKLDSQR